MESSDVTPPGSSLICASAWRRIGASTVDLVITLAITAITMPPILRVAFEQRVVWPLIAHAVVVEIVFLYLIVRYGITPGKLVVGARVVHASGAFPDWWHALARRSIPLAGALFGLLQVVLAVRQAPPGIATATFMDMARALTNYDQDYAAVTHALNWLGILDIAVILTNRRRRAAHDFMARTYVVTQESWAAEKGSTASASA